MRKVQQKTIEKYFNALQELNTVLSVTDQISISKFKTTRKLDQFFAQVLKEGQIIKRIGESKKKPRYIWNTIPPNMEMAKEVVRRINDAKRTDRIERAERKKAEIDFKAIKENKILPPVKPQNNKVADVIKNQDYELIMPNYSIRLFWGLINLRVKPMIEKK